MLQAPLPGGQLNYAPCWQIGLLNEQCSYYVDGLKTTITIAQGWKGMRSCLPSPTPPSRPSPIPFEEVFDVVEDLAEEMEVAVPKLTWKPNMHTLLIHKMEDKEDGKIETLPLPRQLVRQMVDSGKVLGKITLSDSPTSSRLR